MLRIVLFIYVSCILPALSLPQILPRAASAAYCTNYNLTYKLSPMTAPVQGNGSPGSKQTWKLNVDDSSAGYKQTIAGFGATVTDATVSTFNTLSATNLDALLKTLVTSSGASFSLMRHTIGASDLSADNAVYTYDDNGSNGNPDTSLGNFALGSQGTAMANLLAKMEKKNSGLTILGSPWSPPGWMKSNKVTMGNTTNNNLSDQYLNSSQPQYASQFAQYFVKYIKAFTALGASVDAITVQNEPLYSAAGYPTMYMFDYEQAQLIQNFVGPALRNAGLTTSIWAYDHNTDVPSFPQTVLNVSSKYVNTVAWHCYAGSLDWSALTTFQKNNPGVQQYMTECWTPPTDNTNWFQAANFTIGPLQNWASGVQAWTLGTNSNYGPHLSGGCAYCKGLVTINNDGSYALNLSYYLMAQFSRFMPRNAKVLSGTGSSTNPNAAGVQSVASLNPDGTRTVVIMNTFGYDVYTTVTLSSGTKWSGNVPMASVVTWILTL